MMNAFGGANMSFVLRRWRWLWLWLWLLMTTILQLQTALLAAAAASSSSSSSKGGTVTAGAVLALDTTIGNMAKAAIEIAVEDINADPALLNSTLFSVDIRNSNQSAVTGAFQARELVRNKNTVAIIGPQTSVVAEFAAKLGDAAHVPLLTFAAPSPWLSMARFPFWMRLSYSDAVQMRAIAEVVAHFAWHNVALLYVDDDFGQGAIPALTDALRDANARLNYSAPVPPSPTSDSNMETILRNLTLQPSRVVVVTVRPESAKQLFRVAARLGMVNSDYVWIVSNGIASLLTSFDSATLASMQAVLGVRTALPNLSAPHVSRFTSRWTTRFLQHQPHSRAANVNIFALLAYDCTWAVARAVNTVLATGNLTFSRKSAASGGDTFDVDVFPSGQQMKESVMKVKFEGVSGPIQLNQDNGEPIKQALDIVNVANGTVTVVGSWKAQQSSSSSSSSYNDSLIVWPKGRKGPPRGWQIPANRRTKLRIGFSWDPGFPQFVTYNQSNRNASGFCIQVFEAAIRNLGYDLPVEYIPHGNGTIYPGYYNDLVYHVYLGTYDAVVGTITVLANRSKYVDFTQPYTEAGSILVGRVDDGNANALIFLKPFKLDMWLTTVALFITTAFITWLMEQRWNRLFHERSTILWFPFTAIFFTHRETIHSSFARLVLMVWLFAVMVLVSSYTASLSSLLTSNQINVDIQNIDSVISKGYRIGYHQGSFADQYLEQKFNISKSQLVSFSSIDQYVEALNKGIKNGGVVGIFEEKTIVQNVLEKLSCQSYQQIRSVVKTSGFGYGFPKGSPLVSDISKSVLNVSESKEMQGLRNTWFGQDDKCADFTKSSWKRSQLDLQHLWGIFVITASVSVIAVIFHCFRRQQQQQQPPPEVPNQQQQAPPAALKQQQH